MGKHMSDAELDKLQAWKAQGLSLTDMRRRLMSMRAAARERGPSLMTIRRALRGSTFRRSKVETRGRVGGAHSAPPVPPQCPPSAPHSAPHSAPLFFHSQYELCCLIKGRFMESFMFLFKAQNQS